MEKQNNPDESYTNKYQKHVVCSYGYKLCYKVWLCYDYKVCVDDKFSKPFKSYLGVDAVYNFISSIKEESKFYSDMIKKNILTKNL